MTIKPQALADRITHCPLPTDQAMADRVMAELQRREAANAGVLPPPLMADEPAGRLWRGVLANSSHLADLALRYPHAIAPTICDAPEVRLDVLMAEVMAAVAGAPDKPAVMAALRRFKAQAALLIALADCGGVWSADQVVRALSDVAQTALIAAVRYLFAAAARAGQYLSPDAQAPEALSGYFVLGMGKLGARELNYSSDIDLIVFFDPERAALADGIEPHNFFVRITRDLVRLMSDITADGYVFRTDLRLRPDPGSTQVALSVDAGQFYYESVGQNWERAALIKARVMAGDYQAGEEFLERLTPFIWRKNLDYAQIADLHAMKRQIHAHKGHGTIKIGGHNIKLGRGGIREIEFFAQTQQLIAGGRKPPLRTPRTVDALVRLADMGWITSRVAGDLTKAYWFLRMVEHRLQMLADEQTHTLPEAGPALDRVARFAGFEDTESFSERLRETLETVQAHYARLFETGPNLGSGAGNLVFTGAVDDPGTLESLTALGFQAPSRVIATVRGWHFGRYPAMRSARARERLTEFTPALLAALGRTSDPDYALAGFDRFLSALPTGVQLFSLLRNNPPLLELIATIMGSAPRLAQLLSRRGRLLDAVLDPGFFGSQASEAERDQMITTQVAAAKDYQDLLDRLRRLGQEQAFLLGVRVLSGALDDRAAGLGFSALADGLIGACHAAVEAELIAAHGRVPGGQVCVLALGRLGSREMTATSDLDLIIVYDFLEGAGPSDGARPLLPSQYYARFTQRMISALSAPTAEGTLYEVDMRLRPSGNAGPVATRLAAFKAYQASEAWTWEHLALTRARVISGPEAFSSRVEAVVHDALTKPRDAAKVMADTRAMREKIASERKSDAIWDFKTLRGGPLDIDFLWQALVLAHAHGHPEILAHNAHEAYPRLSRAGLIPRDEAKRLAEAHALYSRIGQILRVSVEGRFEPERCAPDLSARLSRAGSVDDLAALEAQLTERANVVRTLVAQYF